MDQNIQIEKWLIKTLGRKTGSRIADMQKKTARRLIKSITGESRSRYKTLSEIILPRIALYKALQQDSRLSAKAYGITRSYMILWTCRKRKSR